MSETPRERIERVLADIHIETGRKDEYERLVSELESEMQEALSKQREACITDLTEYMAHFDAKDWRSVEMLNMVRNAKI